MPQAGYSGTPLVRKLGIRAGSRVALIGAPEGFELLLDELPEATVLHRRLGGPHDVLVAFFRRQAVLVSRLDALRAGLSDAGGLWLAWPKRASGLDTDLSEGRVRELGLATGLVDNKVCAIDATWSALRFVYRLEDRGASRT